jgi:CBS domain-containing protein
MLMLSKIRRFVLEDAKGNYFPLIDFGIDISQDYPFVTHLYVSDPDRMWRRVDWNHVKAIDPTKSRFLVSDFDSALKTDPQSLIGEVLLLRDTLDALILDLLGRTTTRASDLCLELEDNRLRVTGVDVGFEAMLRRITLGYYRRINQKSLIDWRYVEFLRGDPKAVKSGARYRMLIKRLPAGEIAQLASYLPYLHIAELLTLLPNPKAADVLEALPIERQIQVIEEFDEQQAVELLALMSPDLAADLIRRLQTGTTKRYLEMMPKRQSDRIIELLCYPEDSVGGVMVNDIVWARGELTVAEARQLLRERLREPDLFSLIFLVDDDENRKLRGVLSLRHLLTESDEQKLQDLMDPYVETLSPLDKAQDGAYRIIGAQHTAMPVTDSNGKLLGAMTIDAAITQIAPQNSNLQTVRIYS